jgi:DHA1 family multidrug resistance protein-like MFS transporter
VRVLPRSTTGSRAAQREALYLTVFLAQLGTAVAVPILPTLRETFGVSVTAVALTTSVWGLARLAVDLPVGAVTGRVRPGRMLLAGTLLIGGGQTLSALAPSFPVLLAGRAVSGAGSGVVAITVIVRLISLSEPGARGRTLAVYQAALQAGSSLSPSVAGFASALLGWPAAFGIAAVSAFAGTLAAWVTGALRSTAPGPAAGAHGRPADDGRPADGTGGGAAAAGGGDAPAAGDGGPTRPGRSLAFALVVVNVATFTIFFTNGALFQNAIPLFGGIEVGLGAAAIGLILSFATGLRFVVGLVGGTLSDRYGRHLVLLTGFVLLAVSAAAFPLAGGLAGYTVASLLLSATRLGNGVSVALLSDNVGEHSAGRWVSVNRFVGDSGLLIGPAVTGAVIDAAGFAPAFWLTAGVAAVAAAAVFADQRFNRGVAVRPDASGRVL